MPSELLCVVYGSGLHLSTAVTFSLTSGHRFTAKTNLTLGLFRHSGQVNPVSLKAKMPKTECHKNSTRRNDGDL